MQRWLYPRSIREGEKKSQSLEEGSQRHRVEEAVGTQLSSTITEEVFKNLQGKQMKSQLRHRCLRHSLIYVQ